jgi:hypothetical protein
MRSENPNVERWFEAATGSNDGKVMPSDAKLGRTQTNSNYRGWSVFSDSLLA